MPGPQPYGRWWAVARTVRLPRDIHSSIPGRSTPPATTSFCSSLYLSVRPDSRQSTRALHGGDRREPQIVHRGPKPETVFVERIAPDGQQHLVFAGYIHVAGRIFRRPPNFYVLAGHGLGAISHRSIFLHLDVN